MKSKIKKKLKKINIDLNSQNLIKKPLKILQKINLGKFKKITSFSLNETIEKFKDILKHSKRILFLKNKGTITHKDLRRRCSLTVPLKSSTPTIFYESNSIIKLLHGDDTFLQNNEVTHSVNWCQEWRYFLQISFKHPYKEIYECIFNSAKL